MKLVLSLLLVTCADDLAVAIPLGFTVAIAKSAKHGIIIKGATVMERLKDIKYFLTDKTGTLTKGSFVVKKVWAVDGDTKKVLLASAICSFDSKHPISKSIISYAKKENISVPTPDDFSEFAGDGVLAKNEGHEYINGRLDFLRAMEIEISNEVEVEINKEKENGSSITSVAMDGKIIGFVSLEDEIKNTAKLSISETKKLGVKEWIMLTGDNKQVAKKVSDEVGIKEYYFNLKPEEKLEHIKKLRGKHGAVAMMGDGVNDAGALALADVSFAMGAIGSDTSIEVADVTIMHDDLKKIPESIYLSKKTISIVKQNFVIWAFTNACGMFLVFAGIVGPAGASAYNFLTDFLPILNVFRIYTIKVNKHTYDNM